MLVLTRKSGEEIIIGEEIRIRIVEINGGRIRIGIEAPNDVRVLRSEIVSDSFASQVHDQKCVSDLCVH
ncbi:MAG: carbon storage regulator [Planctomycetaceae bacterium]|nr:carbon storage regulator [Planctomycetaceae bacterium]